MIPFPNKKYQIIYADPPWKYGRGVWQVYRPCNKGEKRFINDFYPTISIEDLKKINIKDITNDDCALFMWVTYSHLQEGLDLIKSWGFKYKTIAFIWIKKSNKGKTLCNIGAWTMGNSEMCFIATKGNMLKYKKNNCIRQVIEATRTNHSKKPSIIREKIIELFGDLPRIELFARPPKDRLFEDESYKGWDLLGYDVDGKDIRESIVYIKDSIKGFYPIEVKEFPEVK